MKQWTTLLIGLALLLAGGAAAGFAWAGDRTDSPDGAYAEPPGDESSNRSDDGIDPGECNVVHNINACLGDAAPADTPVGDYVGVLTQALFDLQQRLDLEHIGSLQMAELETTTWPNSCLGVALPPNIVCAQIIVPGFRMVLEADGALHTYHASSDRVVYAGLSDVQGTSGPTPLPPTPVPPPGTSGVHTPEDLDMKCTANSLAAGEPHPLPDASGPSEPLPCDPGLIDGCTVSYPTPDLDATDRFQGEAPPPDAHQGVAITPDGAVTIVDAGDLEPTGDGNGRFVVHPAPPIDAHDLNSADREPCAASADSLPVPVLEPARP